MLTPGKCEGLGVLVQGYGLKASGLREVISVSQDPELKAWVKNAEIRVQGLS